MSGAGFNWEKILTKVQFEKSHTGLSNRKVAKLREKSAWQNRTFFTHKPVQHVILEMKRDQLVVHVSFSNLAFVRIFMRGLFQLNWASGEFFVFLSIVPP